MSNKLITTSQIEKSMNAGLSTTISISLKSKLAKSMLVFLTLLIASVMLSARVKADTNAVVQVGDQAPDFTLSAQDGKPVALKDFLGKKSVVLYFYPKDKTSVCTKEACLFRDSYSTFTDAGAEVLGVSSDTEKSHEEFAQEQHLPFKLLSDPGAQVRKLYGVPSTIGMMPGRVTFVIDKGGIVRLTFNSQRDAEKHVSEALRVLKELGGTDAKTGSADPGKEKS
jgi:thioredoxin-dependent peroxiredoxin